MSFNAIRKNKILAKISEFTVLCFVFCEKRRSLSVYFKPLLGVIYQSLLNLIEVALELPPVFLNMYKKLD